MTGCPGASEWAGLDALDGARRRELLDHARCCASCREALLAGDPAALFSFLALRSVPAPLLERVSSSVREAIASPPAGPSARRVALAGWAAAVLLAATAAGLLRAPGEPFPAVAEEAERRAPASAGGDRRAAVDLLSSPGSARVVDLAVGETQVVMIFDEGIDL